MARLARFTQKIFGSGGSIGEFGSAAAGSPATSTSLSVIQSLGAWTTGWLTAVLGASKFPAIEDMNAVSYVATAQLAYLFQQGIPEYDSGTTYYTNNIVCEAGTYRLYGSKTDTNVGNALSSGSNWLFLCDLSAAQISKAQAYVTTNHTYAAADAGYLNIRSNTGTTMVDTLPGTGTGVMAAGWSTEVVNNDASALLQIVVGSGSFLDGSASNSIILGPGQRATFLSNGTSYYSLQAPNRTKLGANTSIFVASTGSDSANNGLTAATPFLTVAHALAFAQQNIDLSIYDLTIKLADATYTTGILVAAPMVGAGNLIIAGNSGTPSNVIISTTSADALKASGAGVTVLFKDMKVTTATSGTGIVAGFNATAKFSNIVFGACATAHISSGSYGEVSATGNYTINGNAPFHTVSTQGATSINSVTVTLTGTPAFSSVFAYTGIGGYADFQNATFSGSATGVRYLSNQNGVINTNGGGASFLPGNSAGSTATGGIYI